MREWIGGLWRRLTKTKCAYCGREISRRQASCDQASCEDQALRDDGW